MAQGHSHRGQLESPRRMTEQRVGRWRGGYLVPYWSHGTHWLPSPGSSPRIPCQENQAPQRECGVSM